MRRTGFGTNRSFRVPRWLDYRLPAPDQPSFVRWTREVRRLGLGWPRIGPILWVTRAYGSRARRISLTLPADLSNSSGLRNDIASGWICGQERCEFASFLLCPICRPKLLKEFSFDDGQHRSNYTLWAYRRRGQLFTFARETHPTVSEQLLVERAVVRKAQGSGSLRFTYLVGARRFFDLNEPKQSCVLMLRDWGPRLDSG
jgi:hypothetical protein